MSEEPRPPPRRKRGFGAMDPEKQRVIASKGGKASHAQGLANEYTSKEAQAAGKKGGTGVSKDREYMARIGRRGGQAPRKPRQAEAATHPTEPAAARSGEEE